MLPVVLIAVASVALGACLGLLRRDRTGAVGAVHTFAIVAAGVAVFVHLIPEALASVGLYALIVFAVAFAAPSLLERATEVALKRRVHGSIGFELGYAALLVHKIGDGIGLGTFLGPLHAGHFHGEIVLAIAGHTVPVSAVVVLAFAERRGVRVAIVRAALMAVAMVLGVVLTHLVPVAALEPWEPWITAVVSGLLLHILAHEWRAPAHPSRALRSLDVLAVVAGVLFVIFSGHAHVTEHAGGAQLREAVGDAFMELSLETAPTFLIGLLIGALVQQFGSRLPTAWLASGTPLGQALRGAALGLPLPICACGVLPIAQSLLARGAPVALSAAFLFSTPELGIETFALTVRFFGVPFAIVRIVGAVFIAVLAAWVMARSSGSASRRSGDYNHVLPSGLRGEISERTVVAGVLANFSELLYHTGAWTLLGLVAAAYVQAAMSEASLSALGQSGADILLVTALAVPSYVCASSATPLAAVLANKGLSLGAVLTGLLLGPATNVATIGFLRRTFGTRRALLGLGALLSATWCLAIAINVSGLQVTNGVAQGGEHRHGIVAYAATAALALAIVYSIWRTGLRAWLVSLGEFGHRHDHAPHDHGAHSHSATCAHDH